MGRSNAPSRGDLALDLTGVTAVLRPTSRAGLGTLQPGDAVLAGGTWLFSEPQPGVQRLVDLDGLGWEALRVSEQGLHIAATCTVAQLAAASLPWQAASLVRPCCEALLGSFKIWEMATVGGNLCLALPAGPMTALAVALDGRCTIWSPDGGERVVDAIDFVTGPQLTVLRAGEILRAIDLPAAALQRRGVLRRMSLNPLGRSAALLIGTTDGTDLRLSVTAATTRPVRLDFASMPGGAELAARMDAIDGLLHDDVHGAPAWRRQMARSLAEDIRLELTP